MARKTKRSNTLGISKDDAVNELTVAIENADNFMKSEYADEWGTAERYYDGESDLPTEEGRSAVVKTVVRDAIRSAMPNVLRSLTEAHKIVEYRPNNMRQSLFVDQQSRWIEQQFWLNNGYQLLVDIAQESAKHKGCAIKTYWQENVSSDHIKMTRLTASQVVSFQEDEHCDVTEITEREEQFNGAPLYDITMTKYNFGGKVCAEAFPLSEFFISRSARDCESSPVHGHRRSATVAEALEMGLDYHDWISLSDDDPNTRDAVEVTQARHGHSVTVDDNDLQLDVTHHKFLLTEAYCKLDMDGDGVQERYIFWFGGADYQYLHHEQVEDYSIDLACLDPVSFTPIGRSFFDILKSNQDNQTAILRTIFDNAYIANNPRPQGDPTRVNFEDIMNNKIGAPIRTKMGAEVKYADVPFTASGLLPMMNWMEHDGENQVGITKAAAGLDPSAMQSTDRDAVKNTISLAQGQVDYMVRNLVHTALIPMFRRRLRLSIRHMNSRQLLYSKGAVIPVNLDNFDADLLAVPLVGLGTASAEQRLQTLQFVYGEQAKYVEMFGLDNPFTSLSQIYNCLEDMVTLGGITNVGRYFNFVDKQVEQLMAEKIAKERQMAAEQAKADQPIDPSKALMQIEGIKARVENIKALTNMKIEASKLQVKALQSAEELDYKRDELSQNRVIDLLNLDAQHLNSSIKDEQNDSKPSAALVGAASSIDATLAAGSDGTEEI